jgi:hypothetical protein
MLTGMVQAQPRPRPVDGIECAAPRRADLGGIAVAAAEADIGDEGIMQRRLERAEEFASRGDDADAGRAPDWQRRYCRRRLPPGRPSHARVGSAKLTPVGQPAWRHHIPGEQASGIGFRDIQRLAVRREPGAIRRRDPFPDDGDRSSSRVCILDQIPQRIDGIGAPGAVEDDIVETSQPRTACLGG